MKIILTDEEAHHYIDMRDDIEGYKKRIAELEELLNTIPSKDKQMTYYDDPTIYYYPTDTTREEHTSARWSDYDIARITSRIFLTGTYYGVAREFNTVRALFPNRTRAAVTAMIYHLGGTVKKGIVHPRIQPKQKENNA
jgi:RimJ/RimL family protein N-acetyltransferase